MKLNRKIAAVALAIVAALGLSGCEDAQVASDNVSKAADNFEVERRVVMFNGITDQYLLSIEGLCAIVDEGNQLEVTCKDNQGGVKKHFLGLSDNVSYFVEQTAPIGVSTSHYRVTFKPSVVIPDVDAR
jgi:hypothetical protein